MLFRYDVVNYFIQPSPVVSRLVGGRTGEGPGMRALLSKKSLNNIVCKAAEQKLGDTKEYRISLLAFKWPLLLPFQYLIDPVFFERFDRFFFTLPLE